VFLIGEPSAVRISLLFDEQREAPLSYAEVGVSRETPGKVPGYTVDHNRVRLGDGEEVFGRAAEALYAWKMFDLGWVRLLPRGAPVEVGTTVAVLARHHGFRSLNFSRVVYEVSGEDDGIRKLGFAYGTLPEHAESGEERFVVEWHRDGSVVYDLYAFSRPNHLLSRLGYPFARGLQRRFARGSLGAMVRATAKNLKT
jgi:uncharacterized protein (UPF0548 family)